MCLFSLSLKRLEKEFLLLVKFSEEESFSVPASFQLFTMLVHEVQLVFPRIIVKVQIKESKEER